MATKIGLQCKLYRNTGTYANPVWNEIVHAKDVTLSLEVSEADASSRGTGGWKTSMPTLAEASIEFTIVYDPDADDFSVIRDAFLNRTTLDILALDGPANQPGSQGLRMTAVVLKFSRNEPLTDVVTASVTIKPAPSNNAPTWYTTT